MNQDKFSLDEEFGDAQEVLFNYIDWLERTGRLTPEEHDKLLDAATECIVKAISFGYTGESA